MSSEELLREIYDDYKTALLNVKYYSNRLNKYERRNFWLEISIAVTASGSAISGLWVLKTTEGMYFWNFLSVVSAVAAVIKPFLKWPHKIKLYEQSLYSYRLWHYDLDEIVKQIHRDRGYSKAVNKMFDDTKKRKEELVTKPPETVWNEKLRQSCYEEVMNEIPPGTMFYPTENENGNKT